MPLGNVTALFVPRAHTTSHPVATGETFCTNRYFKTSLQPVHISVEVGEGAIENSLQGPVCAQAVPVSNNSMSRVFIGLVWA